MQVHVTFRHMDATDALKDYAQEKIDRIKKYFPDPIKAHVVLSVDRSYDHTAEVTITLHNGIVIRGEETTENMYSSLDLVSAKIERQTRRYKEKIQKHKGQHSVHSLREVRHRVVSEGDDGNANTTVSESQLEAHPMTDKEAVMQMNLRGANFLVYLDSDSNAVSVVYRRDDSTFGVIEPGKGPEKTAKVDAASLTPTGQKQ